MFFLKAYLSSRNWIKIFVVLGAFTVVLYFSTGWAFYLVLTFFTLWLFAMAWGFYGIANFKMDRVPAVLRNNEEYMQQAMDKLIHNFRYTSYRLRSDKSFVLSALDSAPADIGGWIISLKDVSNELRDDADIVTKALILNGRNLEYASERFQNDREYVLIAVKSSGYALQYAPEIFREDSDVVTEAIKRHGSAMEFAADKFKTDKAFVLKAIKLGGGSVLEHVSEKLKDDFDVVTAAISKMNIALMYASERLRKDENIVLAALRRDLRALEFISDEYVPSEKFLEIIFDNGDDLSLASLINDKTSVIKAVKRNGFILRYVPQAFRADKDIVKAAYCDKMDALQYASKELLNDKMFIMELLTDKTGGLKYASETLRNDRDVARLEMSITKNNDAHDGYYGRSSFQYLSDELRADKEIAKKAMYYRGNLAFSPEELRDDKEIVRTALLISDGEDFKYASDRLRNDKKYILKCLKTIFTASDMYQHIVDELKNDKELAMAAINRSVKNAKFIGKLLHNDPDIIELIRQKNRSVW